MKPRAGLTKDHKTDITLADIKKKRKQISNIRNERAISTDPTKLKRLKGEMLIILY